VRDVRVGASRFSYNRLFNRLEQLERFMKNHPGVVEIASKDANVIIPKYLNAMGGALIRNRLVNSLRNTPVDDAIQVATRAGGVEVLPGINKAILSQTDLDKFLKDHPALRQTVISRIRTGTKEEKKAGRLLYDQIPSKFFEDIHIHRSILPHMRAMFADDWWQTLSLGSDGVARVLSGLQKVNSLAKASLFNLNPFFHAMALTMSNFAIMPPKLAFKNTADVWRLMKETALRGDPQAASEIIMRIMSRTQNVAGDDMFTAALASPLKLGRAQVDAREAFGVVDDAFRMALNSIDEKSLARHPFRAGRNLNMMSDRNLWQVVQNVYKLNTWAHIRHAMLKKLGRGDIDKGMLLKIDTEAGNITNQAFGGLAWERLAIQPTMKTFWRFALLAPDWTLSNMLMARDLFVNIPGVKKSVIGKALTRDVLLADQRFWWAAQYNLRAAAYGYLGSNLMNFAATHYRTGKGRWLWQNDDEALDRKTGLKTRIEMPWVREDGRRQFMDIFKQFTEPLALMLNPQEVAKGKIGALPRVTRTMIWGVDSFGNPVAGAEDGPYKDLMLRFGQAGAQFLPIPVQQSTRVFNKQLPAIGLGLSTMGFPISSESLKGFQQREQLEELKQILRGI
jgi:hypothetical protein